MNVTLSQYLAVEGMAESFASALYGEDFIGPWVTGVTGADLEKTREIIGKNLDVAGFMEVRKYIFGDHPMISKAKRLVSPIVAAMQQVTMQYKHIYAKPAKRLQK